MSALRFELPPRLEAHEPPEARGLARDGVRLMVATAHDLCVEHARFRDLPSFLDAGDLLVLNTSATLPAALPVERGLELRLSTPAPDRPSSDWWIVEVRADGGASPFAPVEAGERLELPAGGSALLAARYAGARLWVARLDLPEPLPEYLAHHGRPIRYGYVDETWPLDAYQNVYATEPGSAEMPSAGRPFTPGLVTRLVSAGVIVAPLTLHTGVSSPELGERPYPERYRVPEATARLVNAVRDWGGRVIAVGTTVVRALETAADPDGAVSACAGWTNLVVTPERGLRVVDGLLTGWHEPRASHLDLLQAVGGHALLERSYAAALEHGYLWHEFGDVHLILP